MRLLIIVLNKVECLDRLLTKLGKNNIPGATILDSKGMAAPVSQSRRSAARRGVAIGSRK